MASKTRVYADTSAFIAFLDQSDSYHAISAQAFSSPPPLMTTSLVLAEGHGWFLRRYDAHRALQFLNFIRSLTPLTVIPVGYPEVSQGERYIRRFKDQDLTLADAVGLWVMDKNQIASCWSTDRHLGLTGKRLLIHHAMK